MAGTSPSVGVDGIHLANKGRAGYGRPLDGLPPNPFLKGPDQVRSANHNPAVVAGVGWQTPPGTMGFRPRQPTQVRAEQNYSKRFSARMNRQ